MHIMTRLAGSLLLAGGLAATTVSAASAATPNTANIVCSATVQLPAQDGSTVPLPGTASGSTDCFLTKGDVSPAVGVLQAALRLCNGQSGLAVDDNFGTNTQNAVKAVQSAHHITVDGIYGNQTRGVMLWPDNNSAKCTRPTHF